MSNFLTYVFLLFAFVNPLAYAEGLAAYSDSFIEYCLKLQSAGLQQIGGRPVSELIEKARGIKIELVPQVVYPGKLENKFSATRESAYWDPTVGTIFVSEKHSQAARSIGGQELFNQLMNHEFFRALGIVDEDYNVSSLAALFLKMNSTLNPGADSQRRPVLVSLAQRIERGPTLGGVSGVGGGGDMIALSLKRLLLLVMNDALQDGRLDASAFSLAVDMIQLMKLETSLNRSLFLDGASYIHDPKTGSFIISAHLFSDKEQLIHLVKVFSSAIIGSASRK